MLTLGIYLRPKELIIIILGSIRHTPTTAPGRAKKVRFRDSLKQWLPHFIGLFCQIVQFVKHKILTELASKWIRVTIGLILDLFVKWRQSWIRHGQSFKYLLRLLLIFISRSFQLFDFLMQGFVLVFFLLHVFVILPKQVRLFNLWWSSSLLNFWWSTFGWRKVDMLPCE